jgi:hypothetical protein
MRLLTRKVIIVFLLDNINNKLEPRRHNRPSARINRRIHLGQLQAEHATLPPVAAAHDSQVQVLQELPHRAQRGLDARVCLRVLEEDCWREGSY